MKNLAYLLIIFSINIYGQNNNSEAVHVLIDSVKYSDLYDFDKTNSASKIKILYFNHRKEGFKNSKKSIPNNEVIKVNAQPNINYYEFNSIGTAEEINSIAELNHYSIEDVSKNNKNVWKKYPYELIFIEKLDCNKFKLWKMKPVMNE